MAKGKDKGSRTPDRISKPSSSRSSSSKRSRSSTKVREKSQSVTGRRILSAETESQPTLQALTNSEEVTLETIPAIEDTSPIGFPSPADERGGHARSSIRDQLEALLRSRCIIRVRFRSSERQRDTACLAMRHMNQVNQEMRNDFELAMTRINEQSHAQRQHDHFVTEELAQRLHQERNEAALSLVQLEERAQGDGITTQ